MKKIISIFIAIMVSSLYFNIRAVSPKINETMKTNEISLVLFTQSGSGLIKSIEVGNTSEKPYAFRVYLHSAVNRIRIDWKAPNNSYPMTFTCGAGTNYVDIPYFYTNKFIMSAEVTDVSEDMSDIMYRYETRGYNVIGI